MNEPINNGGQAFPTPESEHEYKTDGMTLRDYFAAKALQGLLSAIGLDGNEDKFAAHAYRLADAMLKSRSTPPPTPEK